MNLEHSVLIKMELCFCHSERKERSSVAKHLSKKKKKIFLLVWAIKNLLQFTLMKFDNFSHLQKSHSNGGNKGHGQFYQKSCTLDV